MRPYPILTAIATDHMTQEYIIPGNFPNNKDRMLPPGFEKLRS